MTKKEARAECRRLAIEKNSIWWALCWNKNNGYFPAPNLIGGEHTNHICYVSKNGTFLYASKENEKKHNLKGNVR
jgi:hypothetical protein